MPVTVISGVVTNVSRGTDHSYAATSQHGPVAIQNQLINFRIDNKPILFRTRTLASMNDGDTVAAAGSVKNGTLEAIAIRNLSTGASYHPPTVVAMVLAAVLILIGIPLIAVLGLGLLFVGYGGFVLYKAIRVRKAAAMLCTITPAGAPPAVPAPTPSPAAGA